MQPTEMKRVVSKWIMSTLVRGHCTTTNSSVSRFHFLFTLAHEIEDSVRIRGILGGTRVLREEEGRRHNLGWPSSRKHNYLARLTSCTWSGVSNLRGAHMAPVVATKSEVAQIGLLTLAVHRVIA